MWKKLHDFMNEMNTSYTLDEQDKCFLATGYEYHKDDTLGKKQTNGFPMRISITGGTSGCPAGLYDIWVENNRYHEWEEEQVLTAQIIAVHQSSNEQIQEGSYLSIPHNSVERHTNTIVQKLDLSLEESDELCKKHISMMEKRERAECVIQTDKGTYGLTDDVPTDIHLAKIWLIDNKPDEAVGAGIHKECPSGDFSLGCVMAYLEKTLNHGKPLSDTMIKNYLLDEKRQELIGFKNRCREAFLNGEHTAYALVGYAVQQNKRSLSDVMGCGTYLPKTFSLHSFELADEWLNRLSKAEQDLHLYKENEYITDYISKEDIELDEKLINLYPTEIGKSAYDYLNNLNMLDRIEERIWEIINDDDEVFCRASYYEGMVEECMYASADIYERKQAEFFHCDLLYMCAIADVLGMERPKDVSDSMFMDDNFSKYIVDAQVKLTIE